MRRTRSTFRLVLGFARELARDQWDTAMLCLLLLMLLAMGIAGLIYEPPAAPDPEPPAVAPF